MQRLAQVMTWTPVMRSMVICCPAYKRYGVGEGMQYPDSDGQVVILVSQLASEASQLRATLERMMADPN